MPPDLLSHPALPAPSSPQVTGTNSGQHLCLSCGLCCDGTLFRHVRLGPGDDPRALRSHGVPVRASRTTPPVLRVLQPCAALCADRRCRIYAERPAQCRAFACAVLLDLEAGRISRDAARRLVRQGRQRAARVRDLLNALGNHEEHLSLDERFQRARRDLESGAADPAAGDLFAELGLAMHRLNLLAESRFHTRPQSSAEP
jgi:Fe-S-cluster containining protein